MAMIKCSECGGDISDKASVCPHCGYEKNFNIRIYATLAAAGVSIFCCIFLTIFIYLRMSRFY